MSVSDVFCCWFRAAAAAGGGDGAAGSLRRAVVREPLARLRGREGAHAADPGEPGRLGRPQGDDVRQMKCSSIPTA